MYKYIVLYGRTYSVVSYIESLWFTLVKSLTCYLHDEFLLFMNYFNQGVI